MIACFHSLTPDYDYIGKCSHIFIYHPPASKASRGYKFHQEKLTTTQIKKDSNEITQPHSTKLLGVTIEDTQKWQEHFNGKNIMSMGISV